MDSKRFLYALLALSFILLVIYTLVLTQYKEVVLDFSIAPSQISSNYSARNVAKLSNAWPNKTEITTLKKKFLYSYG